MRKSRKLIKKMVLGAKDFSREPSPIDKKKGNEKLVRNDIILMQLGVCMIWRTETNFIDHSL